jgi:hypothetical protein
MLVSVVFKATSLMTRPVERGVLPVINEPRYGPQTGSMETALV